MSCNAGPPCLSDSLEGARARATRRVFNSIGFDDSMMLGGGDPQNQPYGNMVRVPDLAGVWYCILLAIADLTSGDRVVGVSFQTTIAGRVALDNSSPTPPFQPITKQIQTSNWHFPDGGVCYTLTRSPSVGREAFGLGPFDSPNFILEDSDQSAVLYTMPGTNIPFTGPLPGSLSLNLYAPAAMRGSVVAQWRNPGAAEDQWAQQVSTIDFPVVGHERFRLYAHVLQTNPSTRPEPSLSTASPFAVSIAPEDQFVRYLDGLSTPAPVRYHGVQGSIFVDGFMM